jgi:hypothetical protein
MPTAPKVIDIAEPRNARSVTASLVSSGIFRGELLCVPGSASIVSELARQVTAIGCRPGSRPPCSRCKRTVEVVMTLEISRRGKEYLKTAQTLLRAAQTMTDGAVTGQLKALADDYQRRAEKASHVDAAKELARSVSSTEGEWLT